MRARSFPLSLVFAVSLALPVACSARGGGGGGGGAFPDDAGGDDAAATTDRPGSNDATSPPADTTSPPDVSTPPPDVSTPPPDVSTPPPDVNTPPPDVSTTPRCGDRMCQAGETCSSCPMDCGTCPSTGGPNYRRETTTATFVDACTLPGATRLLASQDDRSMPVPAPLAMTLFGLPVPTGTPLYVSSNGFIASMSSDDSMTFVGRIPNAAAPNGVVAAYWADLVLGTDGVCVATLGAAPSRRLVVHWKNAQFFSGNDANPPEGRANFEVVYNEADASIDFLYDTIMGQPMAAPTRAAVGVENPTGSGGLAVCSGGHANDMPAAVPCTAVTSGTRLSRLSIR